MKFDRRGIRTSLLVSMGCFTTCQRYSEDAIMVTMLIYIIKKSAWICTVRLRKCIPKTLKSCHTAFYHKIKGQGILTMPMSYKETFCNKSKHPFEEKNFKWLFGESRTLKYIWELLTDILLDILCCKVVIKFVYAPLKLLGQSKAKFNVEPPWEGETKVCINGPGHMTKMAAMPIYGKNL